MNYMKNSKEFQDVGSIRSGKLSHVPSQSAVVPSPRSMSSRDQSNPIHGICLGRREPCLAVHVQQSIYRRHPVKEFFTLGIKVLQVGNPCETVQGDLLRKVKNNLEAQLLLPSFARRPPTMNSFFPADGPQKCLADQQRLQISDLHIDKFPHNLNVFMLEDKIQHPRKFLFRFSLGGNVMNQRSGDCRFGGRSKVIAFISISRILRCWTRGLRLF